MKSWYVPCDYLVQDQEFIIDQSMVKETILTLIIKSIKKA